MCGQAYNQGWQPDNCTTRSFQKHVWLLGTTSYKRFGSTWKYQLVAALRAVAAGSLKKVLLANLCDAPCFGIQFD